MHAHPRQTITTATTNTTAVNNDTAILIVHRQSGRDQRTKDRERFVHKRTRSVGIPHKICISFPDTWTFENTKTIIIMDTYTYICMYNRYLFYTKHGIHQTMNRKHCAEEWFWNKRN